MENDMVISTMSYVPGHVVKSYRGLVWSSTAKTTSLVKDLVAVTKSLAGGDAHAYKHMMNEARKEIVQELAAQAKRQGGNAVLGVAFGSTQILPATIDIFAYGTAVVLEKESKKR